MFINLMELVYDNILQTSLLSRYLTIKFLSTYLEVKDLRFCTRSLGLVALGSREKKNLYLNE